MKNWLPKMLLVMSIIVLTACNNSESKDLSDYPEGVQNGEISVKFYDSVIDFIEEYDVVHYGMMKIYKAEEEFSNVILKKEYIDAIATMDRSFKENVQNLKLKPKTDKDKEVNQLVKNIIALQSDYNEAMWDKAENALPENQTTLFVDRALLNQMYKQLKEKIE